MENIMNIVFGLGLGKSKLRKKEEKECNDGRKRSRTSCLAAVNEKYKSKSKPKVQRERKGGIGSQDHETKKKRGGYSNQVDYKYKLEKYNTKLGNNMIVPDNQPQSFYKSEYIKAKTLYLNN
jgi:hypothetical protein